LKKKYQNENIRFTGPIYDGVLLDNLRYHSSVYVHGHSVGGTNPSLLEAMACQCSILAHDNNFNKAVLEEHASYFSSAKDITMFFDQPLPEEEEKRKKIANIEKIRSIYTYQRITDAYEALMLEATVVVRR
jgi:glycosyltransferase involved in cell wall biosynthesis